MPILQLISTQKQTAQSIANLFETGVVLGEYGNVTVIAGDTGHLTCGRSQTTRGSGNLLNLLQRYCGKHGTRFANRIQTWLPRVEAPDFSLDADARLHNGLREAADDKPIGLFSNETSDGAPATEPPAAGMLPMGLAMLRCHSRISVRAGRHAD